MAAIVMPKPRVLLDTAALVALAAYTGAKLHLYGNDFTPTPNTIISDFVECLYSGYASQTVTWSPPFYDVNGFAVSSAGELLFTMTGATPDTAFGVYLTDTAGTGLLWSARFTEGGFPFIVDGDTLPVVIKFGLDFGIVNESPVP